ncbi:TPA: hypothetical protein ACRYAF_002259 [Pseudomonas aeruginosa]
MTDECGEVLGICALCGPDNGETRVLRKSHFLPKAVYRYLNRFKAEGTKLLLRPQESGKIFSMDRQIFQPLLCDECEGLMSVKGEEYYLSDVLKIDEENQLPSPVYQVLQKKLLLLWNRSAPRALYGQNLILSVGANFLPAIKSRELYHFAVGLFWKATFDGWTFCPAISLRPSLIEQMRRFLLGGDFLQGYIVRVVPSFWRAKFGVVFPALVQGQPFFSIYNFDFYLEASDKKFRSATSMGAVPLLYTVDSMKSERAYRYAIDSYRRAEQTNSSAKTQLSWIED